MTSIDLSACAREPIHIPGAIQPHGALLLLAADSLAPLQASANLPAFLPHGLPQAAVPALRAWWQDGAEGQLVQVIDGRDLSAQRHAHDILLEIEPEQPTPAEDLFARIVQRASDLQTAASIQQMCRDAARMVRGLTGFDRVLVYRFRQDWSGVVVAESRNDTLPSYIDLRFPAADIPAQARSLYATTRLRLIPDVDHVRVPIEPALHPATGTELDLSRAALRAVSPVHLDYMRNMGTAASMSVSILVGGRLWGLIACHSARPHPVARPVRAVCDFVGQMLAMQIAARDQASGAATRVARQAIAGRLLGALARDDRGGPLDLVLYQDDLLALTEADGAAILLDNQCVRAGRTPDEPTLRRICAWLRGRLPKRDAAARLDPAPFATASLSEHWPEAAAWSADAAGLLAIPLSERATAFLLWFRAEQHRTVSWAGNPEKIVVADSAGQVLHPRASFAAWTETVRRTARSWSAADTDAATELGRALTGIVLRRAEALAELSGELARANRELEAFAYSISHDLRAPFRHIVGYAELLHELQAGKLDATAERYLRTIIEAGLSAGRLVDDLLAFSQLGRAGLALTRVDVTRLVLEARRSLELDTADRRIEWRVGELPQAWADAAMLRQVVVNLVSNAVKYTRSRETAVIEVGGARTATETTYFVRDNGVGFDMAYAAKLFGVFQRLHRADEYEGSGIGLALAKRIIDRHGGSMGADGRLGHGATFWFTLKLREPRNG